MPTTIVRYSEQTQDGSLPSDQSRMTEMTEITERIERDQYRVDSHAVASALVERLLAGRTVVKAPRGA